MTATNPPLDQFDLEQIETDVFQGVCESQILPRIFGGQVISQALMAVLRTVEDKPCHSLHSYFLRPGEASVPITYEVERIRDGRSFATRRVTATQKGKAIFTLTASFQTYEEGLSHQIKMPDVPGPEGLLSEEVILKQNNKVDYYVHPVETRSVENVDYLNPVKREPVQHIWYRSKTELSDDYREHQCLLAYASDTRLFRTATFPHGLWKELMIASLDHSVWFHRPFRFDEWILLAMESPTTAGARGFTRGSMFNQQGELIASLAQEGMLRVIDPDKKK